MSEFLQATAVQAGYGGALILKGIDLQLRQGEIGVIAGPNGAGKSTLLKSIFGLLTVHSGSIQLAGKAITNLATGYFGQARYGLCAPGEECL